jgi:hypothetical protein
VNAAPRCSDASESARESLGATATNAEHWLLVEVPGTWPRDVSDGSGLPEHVREGVRAWLAWAPSSRLLFIRRPGRSRDVPQLAFVVHAGEASTEVRRIELASVGDHETLDFARAGEVTDARLVLVCGHGSRDRCCALRGTAVYGALASHLGPEELWVSSHQGGHRFAANVVVLPLGIQLGRLAPDDARLIVDRALAGRVAFDRYRGRTAYAQNVQAAERAVREAEGLEEIADLRLVEIDGDIVRFRSRDDREHVALVEEVVGPVVPASCGAEATPQAAFRARVV